MANREDIHFVVSETSTTSNPMNAYATWRSDKSYTVTLPAEAIEGLIERIVRRLSAKN